MRAQELWRIPDAFLAMQARPEKARQYGLNALNRALEGVTVPPAYTSASGTPRSFTSGRQTADGKMRAMVEGARLMREELK